VIQAAQDDPVAGINIRRHAHDQRRPAPDPHIRFATVNQIPGDNDSVPACDFRRSRCYPLVYVQTVLTVNALVQCHRAHYFGYVDIPQRDA
jgi:hypothetical protein